VGFNNDDYSLYSKKYQINLKKLIKFEIISFFGRIFLSKKPPAIDSDYKYLNLGCGSRQFDGWINADFFKVRFWRTLKSFWMLDLRYPLNCENNYWDGIFTEHTIEHLYPNEAQKLLKELFRTLKRGCWLRVSVPDLRKYIDYYLGKPTDEKFKKWPSGTEAVRALTQNWGHRSLWDANLLKNCLQKIGFINVKEVEYRKGKDENLIMDVEERKWESLYVEAQKPLKKGFAMKSEKVE